MFLQPVQVSSGNQHTYHNLHWNKTYMQLFALGCVDSVASWISPSTSMSQVVGLKAWNALHPQRL
jgi:hypothetical protein